MQIKYYKAGIAIASIVKADYRSSAGKATVIPFKDVNGTEHDTLTWTMSYGPESMWNTQLYNNYINMLASNEIIANFDSEGYQINTSDILNATITPTAIEGTTSTNQSLDITNNDNVSITINCIKGYRQLYTSTNTGVNCLLWAVYLDTPITISAGETKSLILKFSFYNPAS